MREEHQKDQTVRGIAVRALGRIAAPLSNGLASETRVCFIHTINDTNAAWAIRLVCVDHVWTVNCVKFGSHRTFRFSLSHDR
jgi:hypothetical protein